jgi:chorismate dehydratase
LLMEQHWDISPETIPAFPGYETEITGKTAGLIIGNRALEQTGVNAFKYDLSEAWKELTGLPFVFAAWVAVKNLPAGFIDEFNTAVSRGLDKLDELAASVSFPSYDLKKYFHDDIDYHLDDNKAKAMELFLKKIPSYSGVL